MNDGQEEPSCPDGPAITEVTDETRAQVAKAAQEAVESLFKQRQDFMQTAVRQALFSRRVLLVFGLVMFSSIAIALVILFALGLLH